MPGNFAACFVVALLVVVSPPIGSIAQGQDVPAPLILAVDAGQFERRATPIRVEILETRLSVAVRERLGAQPVVLPIIPQGRPGEPAGIAQVDRVEGGIVRITWVLRTPIAAGATARFDLGSTPMVASEPWAVEISPGGSLDLKSHDKPVFRYNAAPVSSPDYGPIQVRDAYIHPAYSPSGAMITGDFSSSHPHHRGFFLAYVHTEVEGLTPDFWNIHLGSGKIVSEGLLGRPIASAVTARFASRHRWEARSRGNDSGPLILRETWEVEAIDVVGAPYFLIDLQSSQQAVGHPLNVLPYRYGGMAYRGPEPFVKGILDVLTSEGQHRRDGDGKAARWVDLTGPIAEGSGDYAGAMIADHPANPGFPTKVRIHPLILPFFSFVPARDRPLTIPTETPLVFRYRILIHDGHPDGALDERVARDFSDPPRVWVEP